MFGRTVTRRRFLQASALATGAVILGACTPTATPAPTAKPQEAATKAPAATAVPTKPVATAVTAPVEFAFATPDQVSGKTFQDDFNNAGLGAKATWQLGEWDANDKTMAAIAAGNPPATSMIGRWQHTDYAARGAIFALDEMVAKSTNFKWSDIWERLQSESLMWGKKWVIPYTTDTRALYYNKDVMADADLDPAKPPKTWQELQDMAVKITKKDSAGRIDRIGFTPTFGNPPVFVLFWTVLWCLGSDVQSDDMQKVTLMDKGPEAMRFLKGLMDAQGGYEAAGAFTKALTPGENLDAFSIGKVGLALNVNSMPLNYRKYAPKLNYGFVAGPVFPTYNINANYDGGGGWYFFKKAKNTEAAWKFVDFWMKPDNMLKWCDQNAQIPSLKAVGESFAKLNEADRRVFVATANTVRWPRLLTGYIEYCGHVATAFDNIMSGQKDIEAELKAATDRMQPLLDAYNKFTPPA
jgi:multiple sugar transport system substrate-binding protein